MAHTKKHTMRQNIAKSQLKERQNRPPTRKRTPFSKTAYLWPDGRYRNQRPPLQSKGLASNKKVEKKVNKVEKKVNKVEKKVEKPKYKQVSQKELDTKVKEMSKPKESKPKKKNKGLKHSTKWIKTSKGTLARRGSVGARKAERKEAARKKVQDLARKRIAAKKNKLKVEV